MNSQTINKETPAPKVSVLVPVYRPREEYLRACIDSILSQAFRDFELLLLDDCPEDRTAEAVIKSYADGRIRYSRNPANLGISASRNLLIDMARGEYLAVMDHDDISLPERLEKETAYLDAHPEVGVVSGRVLKIPQNKASHNPETSHAIKLSLMTVCALTHPAAMIRKSVLQQHHIRYEEEFSPAEDYALWCRLLPHTEFYNLPDILLHYRWHESNTSIVQNQKMHDASYAVRAMVQAENPALYREFEKRARYTGTWKLFGFIPLLRIVRNAGRTKILLFACLPLVSYRSAVKLKGE